ncbi:MAG: class I SAM-dependent methyltransferase [Deltaproteobacteria bacterium]|jgi:ubiquinone/menaquinone biosynthesis C-methylase UbiE|nr:class I SAM-dependent methyltransferase [Deltaproteobacteria bacterium]MBT6490372.1 class I SAM-dependent methyltransferase [Deltaproteobacteria bacterium]
MGKEETVKIQMRTLESLGYSVPVGARILDFGCGAGGLVKAYRDQGMDAYGCDLSFKKGPHAESLHKEGILRVIDSETRRLPFEDNFFDYILSEQVFEHVDDYPAALAEICRILKPTGLSMHVFPSRYRPIEAHIKVPFASIIQKEGWIRFWGKRGYRPSGSEEIPLDKFARDSTEYLNTRTNYLKKSQIKKIARQFFENVDFCEAAYMCHTPRGGLLRKANRIAPFLPYFYSTFRTRVLLLAGATSLK